MANDFEWQKTQDEKAEETDLSRQFEEYVYQSQGGEPEIQKLTAGPFHIELKAGVGFLYQVVDDMTHVTVTQRQSPSVPLPSTAIINALFSPNKAKDLKANFAELYREVWLPENGPTWATVTWYCQLAGCFIGGAVSPVLNVLERARKLIS